MGLRSILLPHGFIQVRYVELQAYHIFRRPCLRQSDPRGGGRSIAGIAGSNPAGDTDVLSLESVVYYQVELFALG